jgi:hypothetical protein
MESTDVKEMNGHSMPPVGCEIAVQVIKDATVARVGMQQKVSDVVVVNEVGVADADQLVDGVESRARFIGLKLRIVLKEDGRSRLLNEFKRLPEDVKVESFRVGL